MNIFQGVFKGRFLSEIGKDKLNNKIWKRIIKKRIKGFSRNFDHQISSSILPSIFSTIYINKNVKILDIGSGGLDVYFELNKIIEDFQKFNKKKFNKKIFLDLVEVPEVLDIYKKFKFSKFFSCNFSTNFKIKKYDIIYISNTLHYIDSPKIFIDKLVKTNSKYIIINSTRMGDIKTFIALQNFYKYKIPTWFFNIKSLLKMFKNYDLIYLNDYLDKYLGKTSEIPMNNYPKKFRLKHSKTIILKSKKI